METAPFFDRLHPEVVKRRARALRMRRIVGRLRHWGRYALALLLVVALWATAHIYYYNRLIDLEFNIQAAWAQVEVQWQRRYHIQQNLTRMVVEYARHERELMLRLTRMRTNEAPSAPPAPAQPGDAKAATPPPVDAQALAALRAELERLGPGELNKLFPSIRIAAEQYPALRLTENFQQFSKAIVDTETTIAEHIETYNTAVNIYTTLLKQFPAIVFAKTCGFEEYQFYRPGRDNLEFRPVETRVDG